MAGAKKTTTRKLGRNGKYDSLIRHVEYAPDPLTGDNITIESIKARWRQPDILDDITRYETGARKVLEKAGLPTDYPGRFEYVDDKGRSGVCDLLTYLKREGRVLEPEWWAAEVLQAAADTRRHMENNNTKAAVRAAMLLQQHVHHAVLSDLEYATIVGTEQLNCHTTYSPNDKQVWQRLADDLWTETPNTSIRETARRIADQTGDNVESIRKHIKKSVGKG